jgi:hypothetical protein
MWKETMGRTAKHIVDLNQIDNLISGRFDISADVIGSIAVAKFKSLSTGDLKEKNKFESVQHLAEWWAKAFVQQDGKCCYCKTPLKQIQTLIDNNLLKTRSVGRDGSGKRGYQFEIERAETETNNYSADNCKLACYYCNNDKSYIFPADDYEQFMGKAKKDYFDYLSTKLSDKK